MLRSTVVRVDHLCCGMEAKLIRDMLGPLEAVAEVKISVTDRRVNVEHTDGLAPESIVDMLNRKHTETMRKHSQVQTSEDGNDADEMWKGTP